MKKIIAVLFVGLISWSSVAQNKEISLSDAVMNQYRTFYPEHTTLFNWIPTTENYSFLSNDYQTLKMGNMKSDKSIDLITAKELATLTNETVPYVNVLKWKDATHFYLKAGISYFLVDTKTKTVTKIESVPNAAENEEMSPDNLKIAYTIGDNLHVSTVSNPLFVNETNANIVTGQAIARSEFGITKGIFWSNTSKYLGFYQKDETDVADYPLLNITAPTGLLESIKYPMTGQTSEKPRVGIYNLETNKVVYITPRGHENDYLTNFGWGPKDAFFYVAEVNRGQNHMHLNKYNALTGEFVKTLFEEKNDKWVEPEHPVYFVNDNQFIWMSEKDGFMNLYLYDTEGVLVKQLTTNKWVVKEIIGHDANGNVYFQGTGPSSMETHVYQVNLKNDKQVQLTQGAGTHNVVFNSNYTYMYDAMSAHDVPNKEVILNVAKGKVQREIVTAKNPYEGYKIGTAEIGTIKAADGKTDLNYRLIKPSDFDATKKYPVFVYVYGGPHAQMITNSWMDGANLWMYWMAEQGYLVYTLDNRGSANRGFEFESVIHRNLGDVEMDDQLQGVKHLKSMPFVDGNRLAVHGWSYGGFMATSLMLRNAGVFNVGVAGGPVTDWKYYEVMYGERYMDTPEENPEGYKKSSLMNYVENLQGDLLLIHGTSDNVVVMQHNLVLVKAFVEAGVQMDFFPYPMHEHNVRGKDRVHLMQKVLDYVIEKNK